MEELVKDKDRGNAFVKLANISKRIVGTAKKRDRSFSKLLNIALCKLSLRLGLQRNLGKPYFALVETSNLCNLECPLCPTGEGTLKRAPQNMSFEMFKKIIDEMARHCIEINITNYGEPLLNKEIHEMIYYAKQKRVRIVMGTNAHFLKDEKDRRALIISGLDEVYFSLDGTDQESYEMYRRGGDFSLVVSNIESLIKLKHKMHVNNPLIELQFLVMKQNEDQVEEVRKLAERIGVDRLSLKLVSFNNADWDRDEIISRFLEFEPADEKYRLYKHGDGGLSWKRAIENRCPALWSGPTILADGTIVPCCLDPRGELPLGHVDEGILTVWNNDRYQNLRKQVVRDKREVKLCSKCLGL